MDNYSLNKRPYRLVDYDPKWPKQYEIYTKQIKAILGTDLLEMHHFGSTSIPGMLAKPNIDIFVLASSLNAVRAHIEQFENSGFISRGDYSNIGEEYFTKETEDNERIASIHVFEGSPKVFDNYRNFRDYLLAHKEDRENYANLKRQLYSKYKDDYSSYDSGKQELIAEIKQKANLWAVKLTKETE